MILNNFQNNNEMSYRDRFKLSRKMKLYAKPLKTLD